MKKPSLSTLVGMVFAGAIGAIVVLFTYTTSRAPPITKFPELAIRDIGKDVLRLERPHLEMNVSSIVRYRNHLDLYISEVCRQLDDESRNVLCQPQCHLTNALPVMNVPQRPHIEDDGSLNDDEIIERLIEHIREVKGIMREQNSLHRDLNAQNTRSCLRKY